MNSDHVTGRAYDLVGQNLGQYQSLVKATGGFAEFHGVNNARHLHVVPGSGAMGDRPVPVMSGSTTSSVQMSSSGEGNSYNFYVTGNQNASAKEIAEMVMLKVKEVERSNRERR
jgi:predicted amidohydrolase